MSLHNHAQSTSQTTHFIQQIPLDSIVCDTDAFKQDWTTSELEAIGCGPLEERPAPIIVESLQGKDGLFQVLFGLKYFIAANLLSFQTVPALVLHPQHNNTVARFDPTLFTWDQLDEIECTKAYEWLNSICKYTIDEIAKMRKISRPVIGNQLRLLKLPHSVQRLLKRGDINKSICLLLLKLSEPKIQSHLADTIVKEALFVREAQTLIRDYLPKRKKKSTLNITVHPESIEVVFDSIEQRDQIIAYLKNSPLFPNHCYECSNIDH